MEVPRLRVEMELQLLAYTTAMAISDPVCICDLCHNSSNVGFFFFFLSFFFGLFVVVAISWAAPAAYGGSQARG